ncbi:hypothetical protein [Ensifer sp. 1H6]|uniref:hypothetical protein n=1 Tax=Ensifer sp. 1H6 TaxID=1911585 RepID=UPI0009C7180D|nr:hypothetical protein [Ensifer sp. 1H6]OMQ44911.1 hypothetical protein BKP54_10980 [Ensifer sp. 1H6]
MSKAKELETIEQLLFEAPLYAEFTLNDDLKLLSGLAGRTETNYKFDAHCPYCRKTTTWVLDNTFGLSGVSWQYVKTRKQFEDASVTCSRDHAHKVHFFFQLYDMRIQKVGQLPSLADISNSEVADFRKHMTKEDASEFYKAVGLAAHGVGVGSFVYLRRVFERLVYGRFTQFKDEEEWSEEDFQKLRMAEKIDFLKGHLPKFLVEHAKIYSILSVGVHELSEEHCLQFFDILKQSIVIILQEDDAKRSELEMKKKFSLAINTFVG